MLLLVILIFLRSTFLVVVINRKISVWVLVRRRGPRRIPGPRRPHPCGKDIMIFSLSDFFGYSMAVTSACDYLKLSPEDFHNWEVRLDGVRFISGSLSYDVSLRQLEKPAKGTQGKPKKQN